MMARLGVESVKRLQIGHVVGGVGVRVGRAVGLDRVPEPEDVVACLVAADRVDLLNDSRLFERHGVPDTAVFGHAKDGNLHFVLAEDVRSPAAVERYGGVPPYPETRAYVAKILGLLGGAGDIATPTLTVRLAA